MKTYTVSISEKAYKRIRSEVMTARLANPEGMLLKDEFLMKLFKAWDNDEVAEVSLKSEHINADSN